MRIYAAQTLLHAAEPLNTFCELTPNLISSSQSEFYKYTEFPDHYKECTKGFSRSCGETERDNIITIK